MKKLFKVIRQGDFEEVKATLENYPEALDEASTPPPKKDDGLSPLQVALKIGEFDIAKYLIDLGANVNYIEDESKDTWRMPVLQDAIGAVFFRYQCHGDTVGADKAAMLVRELLERGADPKMLSYQKLEPIGKTICRDAIDQCVWSMNDYLRGNNFGIKDIAVKQFFLILDLLLEYGADFEAWAERPVNALCKSDDTNRKRFLDDFVPVPDETCEIVYRGKKQIITTKGDVDKSAEMRALMQAYCKKIGKL